MSENGSSFVSVSEPSASQPSIIDVPSNGEEEEVDTLPSETDSDDLTVSDDYGDSDAEREWKESLQQLELLLSMVIVPYLGKYFGRKFAYWGWKQFMEWKYPVKIVVTSPGLFKGVGAIEAAASL
jgi:Mitochondrial import 2